MDILDFIDKAIGVEEAVAECYSALSRQCEPGYAGRLMKLSNDEINHRNILNMVKTFVMSAPDLFGKVAMPEQDLDAGRKSLGPLREAILAAKGDWWESLAKLKDLEVDLERIHLTASIAIRDPSLRALFKALSTGDQNHGSALARILSESRCRRPPLA